MPSPRRKRSRVLERASHVGRGARSGDADHEIAGANTARVQIFDRAFDSIFGAFLRAGQRRRPPAMMPCTISGSVP